MTHQLLILFIFVMPLEHTEKKKTNVFAIEMWFSIENWLNSDTIGCCAYSR